MSVFYPQIWRNAKTKLLEIRYADRVEIFKLVKHHKINKEQQKDRDDKFYHNEGYRRLSDKNEQFEIDDHDMEMV